MDCRDSRWCNQCCTTLSWLAVDTTQCASIALTRLCCVWSSVDVALSLPQDRTLCKPRCIALTVKVNESGVPTLYQSRVQNHLLYQAIIRRRASKLQNPDQYPESVTGTSDEAKAIKSKLTRQQNIVTILVVCQLSTPRNLIY